MGQLYSFHFRIFETLFLKVKEKKMFFWPRKKAKKKRKGFGILFPSRGFPYYRNFYYMAVSLCISNAETGCLWVSCGHCGAKNCAKGIQQTPPTKSNIISLPNYAATAKQSRLQSQCLSQPQDELFKKKITYTVTDPGS